jgi:hypothetical protein
MTPDTYIKAPNDVDRYNVIWCDLDGTNDGGSSDDGTLQGATISSSTWVLDSGITEISSDTDARTISTVSYDANTIASIRISEGIDGTSYNTVNRIVTSDGRTLDKTITIIVDGIASASPWPITIGTYIIGGAYTIS